MTAKPFALGEPRPEVPLVLQCGSAHAGLAQGDDARAFERSIGASLDLALGRLGLDGECSVQLTAADSARPVRVLVHGHPRPYRPALVRKAWLSVAPRELHEIACSAERPSAAGFPTAWLDEYVEKSDDRSLLFSFLEQLVYAAVLEQPSCLMEAAQVAAYSRDVRLPARELSAILPRLLDLGVSISNRPLVEEIIREGQSIGRPPADTVEAAFAELRANRVELSVHPATLLKLLKREPTGAAFTVYGGHSKVQRLFRGFEETFFAEFGFLLPDLVWMPSTTMPEGTLSLGIDAWSSLPAPIIVRGERVVDSPPERLPVPGRPAVHPVTGARCAIVADAKKEELEKAGFNTWGPIDFVLLNVFSEVMPRAGRLLGIEDVEYQLARLNFQLIRSDTGPRPEAPSELVVAGQAPTLVDETLTRYSLGELTRVLRFLVSERLSMQNLGGILDRLLQYDTVPVESDTLVVLDSRLALRDGISEEGSDGHYEFLRKQLRSFLSYRFAWQENTVVAYLLDPDLEHDIVADLQARRGNGGPKLSESRIESFRDAVWNAVTALGPAPLGQVILTTPAARTGVLEFLAPELPELPVLAYSELRPDVNVQPIARIAAD